MSEDVQTCQHKNMDYSVIGDKCLDCGQTFQHEDHELHDNS